MPSKTSETVVSVAADQETRLQATGNGTYVFGHSWQLGGEGFRVGGYKFVPPR